MLLSTSFDKIALRFAVLFTVAYIVPYTHSSLPYVSLRDISRDRSRYRRSLDIIVVLKNYYFAILKLFFRFWSTLHDYFWGGIKFGLIQCQEIRLLIDISSINFIFSLYRKEKNLWKLFLKSDSLNCQYACVLGIFS